MENIEKKTNESKSFEQATYDELMAWIADLATAKPKPVPQKHTCIPMENLGTLREKHVRIW